MNIDVLDDFASLLFAVLREMDDEADTVRDGHNTGLYWYAGHARPELLRPQTEPEWSKRIAALLGARGYGAQAERAFPTPHTRTRCDVVVTLADGPLWLEVKGAWKNYWQRQGGEYLYRSHLLHPLVEGLDAKSHTPWSDIEKLARLTRDDAAHAGILLLGFDTDTDKGRMDADVADLVRLSGLGAQPWRSWGARWPDARRPGDRVHAWLWVRAVEDGDRGS